MRRRSTIIEERERVDDFYRKMSAPLIIEGGSDLPQCVFFGGLGTTGYSWNHFAEQLNRATGAGVAVHTLAGHEDGAESMKHVRWQDWVDGVKFHLQNKAGAIGFGFSTGALALLHVVLENPGICRGMVLVAPPLYLKRRTHKYSLATAHALSVASPAFKEFTRSRNFSFGRISDDMPEALKRAPRVPAMPASSFIELHHLQRIVKRDLNTLSCPVYLAIADSDELVHPKVARILGRCLPARSTITRYDSRHNIILDTRSHELFDDVFGWLRSNLFESDLASGDSNQHRR